MSLWIASLALGQLHNSANASDVTMTDTGKSTDMERKKAW